MITEETKKTLRELCSKLLEAYSATNRELLFFWRKYLSKQSSNKLNNALRILIENPATALFLNTFLFYAISMVFGGVISVFFFYLSLANIVCFSLHIL